MSEEQKHAKALEALRILPDLCAQLDPTERTPGPKMHGAPGSRPPLRLDVIDLLDTRRKQEFHWADVSAGGDGRHGVLPSLEWWTRWIHADRADADLHQPELVDTPTIASECAYLVSVWDYVGAQDYAPEIRGDIKRLLGQVRHALGIRREYRPSCRECSAPLTAMDNSSWWSCEACGRDYPISAGLHELARIQVDTLPNIAAALNIPKRTLQDWAQKGIIKPEERSSRGKIYALADVARVQARMRETRQA